VDRQHEVGKIVEGEDVVEVVDREGQAASRHVDPLSRNLVVDNRACCQIAGVD
jgi:hypothetical protein